MNKDKYCLENLIKNSSSYYLINEHDEKLIVYDPYDFDHTKLRERLNKNKKIYSADTSTLLIDPIAPFRLLSMKIPQEIKRVFANRYGLNIADDEKLGEPNNFVLSQIVEKELDKIKDNSRRDPYIRFMARRALEVIRYFYEIGRENNEDPREGISLENGSYFIHIPHDEIRFQKEFERYYEPDNDIRILSDLLHIEQYLDKKNSLILITEDGGLVNKAETIGVSFKLEHYKREKISRYDSAYSGKIIIKLNNNEELNEKYSNINIIVKKDLKEILEDFGIDEKLIHPNMILKFDPPIFEEPWQNYLFITGDKQHIRRAVNYEQYLKDCKQLEKRVLKHHFDSEESELNKDQIIHKINKIKEKIKKRKTNKIKKDRLIDLIKEEFLIPENTSFDKEEISYHSLDELLTEFPFYKNIIPEDDQIAYMELLLSKEIQIVSVIGEQGAGKSVLALLAGIYQVWNGDYEKIIYIRSTKEIGAQSLGYLPGSESDKMEPWKRSVRDNLRSIFIDKNRRGDLYYKQKLEDFISYLEKMHIIEYSTAQFSQGRTFDDSYVIIDEAQNFTRQVLSILIGRLGENSKGVVMGDPKQLDAVQYSDRFVNIYNTGIIHVAEKLKELPISAHIKLPKGFSRRSKASEAALRI